MGTSGLQGPSSELKRCQFELERPSSEVGGGTSEVPPLTWEVPVIREIVRPPDFRGRHFRVVRKQIHPIFFHGQRPVAIEKFDPVRGL